MSPCAPISVSVPSEDEANPFMTRVDAAASLLETTEPPTTTSSSSEGPPPQQTATSSELAASTNADPSKKTPHSTAPEDQGSRTSTSPAFARSTTSDHPEHRDIFSSSSLLYETNTKLPFVERLMAVLDNDANYSGVIAWMPDGKAFTIVNPKSFTKVEMPAIFNIRNMSSFVRKLTRFGFHRFHEKETMNFDIFKNEHFQRGNPKLCSRIKYQSPLGSRNNTPVSSLPSSCVRTKWEAPTTKQVMGAGKRTTIIRKPKTPQQRRRLPSVPPLSVCATASTTTFRNHDAVHDQYYEKALKHYMDDARRGLVLRLLLIKQQQLAYAHGFTNSMILANGYNTANSCIEVSKTSRVSGGGRSFSSML